MARKVIIDCDPGIDDAVALCLALFDPRLDVVAVTAAAGNVDGQQASRNVQSIIERLDPPRWPRIGAARPCTTVRSNDARQIHGSDGLGNTSVEISELHHPHPSDKIITDAVRNDPGNLTIITLGPLTNVAAALRGDPDLASMIDRIMITGGTVSGIGNVTPSAEFNMYCDPEAARVVFHSPLTKTLVPLDVTRQAVFTLDFLDQLPEETSRAGQLLRQIIPFVFRSYRQQFGQEGVFLHDAITILAAVQPECFRMVEMAGDIETSGELTSGATIFDRRPRPVWRNNMEVAIKMDVEAVMDGIQRGLRFAGQESNPG